MNLTLNGVNSYCIGLLQSNKKEYIKSLRLNSSETEYIVAQLDFAENFTILHQREVQGHHWNNQQVTLFTVHLKIGSNSKNIVIISDYTLHNLGSGRGLHGLCYPAREK